jgi:hypothetical protein
MWIQIGDFVGSDGEMSIKEFTGNFESSEEDGSLKKLSL